MALGLALQGPNHPYPLLQPSHQLEAGESRDPWRSGGDGRALVCFTVRYPYMHELVLYHEPCGSRDAHMQPSTTETGAEGGTNTELTTQIGTTEINDRTPMEITGRAV